VFEVMNLQKASRQALKSFVVDLLPDAGPGIPGDGVLHALGAEIRRIRADTTARRLQVIEQYWMAQVCQCPRRTSGHVQACSRGRTHAAHRWADTLRLVAVSADAAPVPGTATSDVGLRVLGSVRTPAPRASLISSHPAGSNCAGAAAQPDSMAASRSAITFEPSIRCLVGRRAWPADAAAQLVIPYLIVADELNYE